MNGYFEQHATGAAYTMDEAEHEQHANAESRP